MLPFRTAFCALAAFALPLTSLDFATTPGWAQDVAAATTDTATPDTAPSALTEDELQMLVARIALYPDDLVALISSASLYPLQIVEAERFLEDAKSKPDEQPKDSWDGSVISLLNYPEIVKMMSDDLDWTQDLGTALAYQQKDVLLAIQQLRDEAVAENVIKSDDKLTVTHEGENVVIQSASPDTVYIPQYPPEMLYEPDYDVVPISYYPDPYPYYYDPAATYFAGVVTGAVWAAAVDWNDWGVWGGDDWGNEIDINCDHCFNNLNGRVNINDVDWKNVDRSKVKFDRDQFTGARHTEIRNSIKNSDRNSVRAKAADIKRGDHGKAQAAVKARDVRADHHQANIGGDSGKKRPAASAGDRRPGGDAARTASVKPGAKATATKHKASKPKAAARPDGRSKKPSALGEVKSGKHAKVHSSRGHKAMGGSGRPHKSVNRGGGGRHAGGGGGGHRGGGGRHR